MSETDTVIELKPIMVQHLSLLQRRKFETDAKMTTREFLTLIDECKQSHLDMLKLELHEALVHLIYVGNSDIEGLTWDDVATIPWIDLFEYLDTAAGVAPLG